MLYCYNKWSVTLSEIFEKYGVIALGCAEKPSLYYLSENYVKIILPDNTVILKLLKSHMNLKMHPDDSNVFASNVIDKYKSWPNKLHSMCLTDFVSSYISKKADDLLIEPDEIKSYTVPVSNINDVKLNPNMIVWKNELGEMRKRSQPCVICFNKVCKLRSPEEH